MKKFIVAIAATVLLSTGCATAGNNMASGKGMMMDMKKFDANGDGMISKEESMKMHEAMFDRMKGENGMIVIKDMQKNCMGMTEGGHPMPNHMEKGTK